MKYKHKYSRTALKNWCYYSNPAWASVIHVYELISSGQLIFPSGITVAYAESINEPQLEVWGIYNKVFFNSCVRKTSEIYFELTSYQAWRGQTSRQCFSPSIDFHLEKNKGRHIRVHWEDIEKKHDLPLQWFSSQG